MFVLCWKSPTCPVPFSYAGHRVKESEPASLGGTWGQAEGRGTCGQGRACWGTLAMWGWGPTADS